MNQSPFQGWILSLSNGTQILEGVSQPGDRTSWQQAIDFIHAQNIKATALSLMWKGYKVRAIPKADGYFQGYDASILLFGDRKTAIARGIGSVFGDLVYITWIMDGGEIKQDIRPLKDNLVHTTLRT